MVLSTGQSFGDFQSYGPQSSTTMVERGRSPKPVTNAFIAPAIAGTAYDVKSYAGRPMVSLTRTKPAVSPVATSVLSAVTELRCTCAPCVSRIRSAVRFGLMVLSAIT